MTIPDGPMELPHIEEYSDTPVFNTKAVVQQTGVPAPTLRAWERRYALLTPERAENAYRLYSERDISLIRWLKERIDQGMSISQAVALFRHLSEARQQRRDPSPVEGNVRNAQKPEEDTTKIFQVTQADPSIVYAASAERPANRRWEAEPEIIDAAESHYSTAHSMRIVQNHLIEIFQNLDEQTAHVLMGSMFSLYSLEQVCSEIITPTLWRIGELWANGKLTVTVEHFASNFFRALLTNRFYVTPGPLHGPLVLVGCAPHEAHELAALMLALFLRRKGLRVAYLGQSVETTGLLHTIGKLNPAIICLSVTIHSNLSELIQLSRQIQSLPAPRPILVFGGRIFTDNEKSAQEVQGVYVRGDLKDTANTIQQLLQDQERSQHENSLWTR